MSAWHPFEPPPGFTFEPVTLDQMFAEGFESNPIRFAPIIARYTGLATTQEIKAWVREHLPPEGSTS